MPYNKGPDRLGAAWAVDMQAHLPEKRPAEAGRLMAWARERKTGAPRYILELDENHRGAHCDCECVSCGGALIAVNAARETYLRRPHFRHTAGTEKHSCLVLAARTAILATLESTGYLDLPSRRRTARITGLSGRFYDAWVDAPAERVHIASCSFSDEAAAIVTLDDGRELHVVLVGGHAGDTDGPPHAAIEVLVDDVALAAMSPEELRHRTRLLVSGARWCGHWQDNVLLDSAMDQARAQAADALDLVDGEIGLSDAATPKEIRETLLHRKAKEILEREKRLMVPQMSVTERSPQWPREAITRKCRDAQELELTSVALEQRVGRIVPDVTATTLPAPGWSAEKLLIEITVTNRMDVARLARIREADLPTLEIDLSRLGGKVTESEFTRLIVEEVAGKRWLHHPTIEAERGRLHAEWTAAGAARPVLAPRRERSSGSLSGEGRYPSQRYAGPKETDLWLKGEALERWKRENPESAAIWFPEKD
ncbi:hypothetical protein ACTJK6_08615 [Ralstonia sp. 22086]|uniref:hypothetical protein n=1 Tax=Ralstonia sp. 22086 TaxID=3453870 RepID=UPI000FD73026